MLNPTIKKTWGLKPSRHISETRNIIPEEHKNLKTLRIITPSVPVYLGYKSRLRITNKMCIITRYYCVQLPGRSPIFVTFSKKFHRSIQVKWKEKR